MLVATERSIDVVKTEARQSQVPALPIVCRSVGCVGRCKIVWQFETKQRRRANGDVGVSRKVAIDLKVEGAQSQERRCSTCTQRGLEQGMDHTIRTLIEEATANVI